MIIKYACEVIFAFWADDIRQLKAALQKMEEEKMNFALRCEDEEYWLRPCARDHQ